ncbi:serine hydrolase [Streptomyces sp. NPDC002520]
MLRTVLVAVALAGATAGGTVYVKAHAHAGAHAVSSAASPSATPSGRATEEASVEPATEPSPSAVDRKTLLSAAMKAVRVPAGAEVSVAVLDLDSGAGAAFGDAVFDTASIVKVDILAALLLQAQDAGRRLTEAEKAYATKMVGNSDNASASALWRTIGRARGLDAANARFGLTATSGGDGELWGLTQTTAGDQLLLRQVFGQDSVLSAASRTYVQGLMKQVEADQQWGISAAAAGGSWALKNGWLARSTTGLWVVNSIGRVTVDGTAYLVAVLSKGTVSQGEGRALVEAVAKAAVSSVASVP